MKCLVWRAVFIALLLPIFVVAEESARSEYASVLKAKPDPVHGAQLFGQCISCHGADGGGDVNGSSPRIAGQHYRVIAKQIVDFRYGKRWDFRVEGMADRHHITGVQDIADVAAYVSEFSQPGKRGTGSGEFVAEGSRIYAKHCQSCHGKGAEGNAGRGVPRLAATLQLSRPADVRRGRRPASRIAGTAFAAHRTTRLRTGAGRRGFPGANRLAGKRAHNTLKGSNLGGVMRVRLPGRLPVAQA